VTGSTKLKRTLALTLAGGALAIGVPAALAAGGDGGSQSTAPSNSTFIQDEGGQDRQDRGDGRRGDCPEKDGDQQGSAPESGSGSGSSGSGSTAEL
jgi:hypothetical protein